MNLIFIIFTAFALALDAFAVASAAGAYFGKTTARQKFRLAFHFGLFQFLMPIIGWLAGSEIVEYIADYDHWIALVILSIIGVKMIWEGSAANVNPIKIDITKGMALITLSIATSIDALAVGFSIGIMNTEIIFPSIVIGIVAAAMTLAGIKLGEFLSSRFGQKALIVGGIILILIGIHIVLEHLQII